MQSSKKQFRRDIKDKMAGFSPEYISTNDEGIYKNVISLPEYTAAGTIFIYYSIEDEPSTGKIISDALAVGKTVALPACFDGGIMEARIITDTGARELVQGKFCIPEPAENAEVLSPDKIDLIVVPALAFSKSGYRIGKGGGYYDRYLIKTNAVKVGITREQLVFAEIPVFEHDVGVDILVTENTIARLD